MTVVTSTRATLQAVTNALPTARACVAFVCAFWCAFIGAHSNNGDTAADELLDAVRLQSDRLGWQWRA
jgi:hypothetical protein